MGKTAILKENDFQRSLDRINIAKRYKNYIRHFLTKTESSFTFRNIDKRLETLTIKKINTILARKLSFGSYYDIIKNEIKLLSEEDIYHELFHAFTSYKKSNSQFGCGFYQYNYGIKLAKSLDEGYTDLLAKRYFNTEIFYTVEANIASKIELIFGKEEMETLYCNNGLSKLIQILSAFSSKQEVRKFLLEYDKLDKCNYEDEIMIKIMNDLSNYLIDIYLTVLVEKYIQGKITSIEVSHDLSEFKEKFENYAFNDKEFESYYLKSPEYNDLTAKLSNKEFQKQLIKKS